MYSAAFANYLEVVSVLVMDGVADGKVCKLVRRRSRWRPFVEALGEAIAVVCVGDVFVHTVAVVVVAVVDVATIVDFFLVVFLQICE